MLERVQVTLINSQHYFYNYFESYCLGFFDSKYTAFTKSQRQSFVIMSTFLKLLAGRKYLKQLQLLIKNTAIESKFK